ncbi:hypothetical protein BGX28_010128 [Mortierella sp. GBA30]|nr:hypothetical protein BGX28_010128 [Mortierella sp. GBA30]
MLDIRLWLKPEVTLTIGRQVADDVLSLGKADTSVGRRHLAITVSKPTMTNVRVRGEHTKLTIRDLSSTNGVFVDGERIEPDKNVEITILTDNAWIKQEPRHVAGRGYGGFVDVKLGDKTSFRLERVDWSICSLGLTAQSKLANVALVTEIDAKVEDTWVPGTSTHLIIDSNKPTEKKLFLALAEGGYLVNKEWLKAQEKSFKESWETKGEIRPQAVELDYPGPIPSVFEGGNIHWAPNHDRRTLFKNHQFISVTGTKYGNLSQVIECAGGIWSAEDARAIPRLIRECMAATRIPVLLCPSKEANMDQMYPNLETILQRMGYRWVIENEIGMAIVYASTEMYCNPKYHESLPTVEMMASLQASQVAPSQYMSSLGFLPTLITPSVSESGGAAAGDAKESPHIIQDDDGTSAGSFSFSQLMAPTRTKAHVAAPAAPQYTPKVAKPGTAEKRDKKKAKTDHMAMFFDGLDDDEDIIVLDEPDNKGDVETALQRSPSQLPMPTAVSAARHSSSLQTPVPVAWPEPIDLSSDTIPDADTTMPASPEVNKQDSIHSPSHDEEESIVEKMLAKEMVQGVAADSTETVKQETLSQPSKGSSSKKKPSAFEAIRNDMVALKLDVKLGRQKENLEEREKWQRIEAQRQAEKSKGVSSKLMQSQTSELLLAKNKRQKLSQDIIQETLNELPTVDNRTGDKIDKKDWPERWKALPNFKNSRVSPLVQERWKNVPNFKTFRKSTMPGVHVDPSPPRPVTVDGVLIEKQEETIQKIGQYLQRPIRNTPPESPLAPRRKVSEKQMARDDLKALLTDD